MDASSVITTLDTGLPRTIKTFGGQYFFVALEPRRQYDDSDDDEDDAEQAETKVQVREETVPERKTVHFYKRSGK